ncbi:MAG: MlaD family protein [Desulfuromonadales bacterium]|nr:MlaD family protein [Desulfuromonadales bacterium]
MTDQPSAAQHAATARVKPGRSFSIIWLVPLVALLIGGWLAFKAFQEKGPTVSITFVSAEGLEAGKTKIKYKDVDIGLVKEIRLSEDLKQVLVTAELQKDTEKYLNDKTRFWVVRAQIRGGTVSGLGTLLAGAYIGIDPATGGQPTDHFTGLEVPPVVTSGLPGRHFWLRAERLGSLSVGKPVYYRQIQVGQVVSYGFSPDGQAIDLQMFIEAPHHTRVTENTRFYNASGVDVSLSAQGLKVQTESLITVLGGGLAFELPNGTPPGKEANEHAVFRLYPNRESIQEKTYTIRKNWLLIFEQSVRGLSVGAPVEMHGIKVGEVVSLELKYDVKKQNFLVPVVVAIEPERIRGVAENTFQASVENPDPGLKWLVEQRNLRAQLKTGSMLTGQLLVDLAFQPRAARAKLAYQDGYPVVPTIGGSLEQIQESVARITSRIEKIPFEQIGSELHETLKEAKVALKQAGEFAGKLNNETAPQLKANLDELQKTLVELQGAVGKDSPLSYNAKKTLEELTLTLRSLRELTDSLERRPESMLFGKGGKEHE